MVSDAEKELSIFAATRRAVRWMLATLSSHAGKAAKTPPRRLALDGTIPAPRQRKQARSPRVRHGVGMDGERASAIRGVGTIGVSERTMGVSGLSDALTRHGPHPIHPMSAARHPSSSSRISSSSNIEVSTTIIPGTLRLAFRRPRCPSPQCRLGRAPPYRRDSPARAARANVRGQETPPD
jgi:hypothetical protein